MRIAGKNTVITGASSGLGRALALEAARRGSRVTLVARHPGPLRGVAAEIRDRVPDAQSPIVAPADVSNEAEVQRAFHRAAGDAGPIDVLINNAGISLYGLAEQTSADRLRRLCETNLIGPLNTIRAVLPSMLARGSGLIVNVSSAAALYGVPYLAAYGATKAGLASLGQSLRAELAGSGVSVSNVYPGYTDTPLFDREVLVGGARRPEGPYADPARVARQVLDGLERGRSELILSPEGKALSVVRRVPRLLDRALARVADRLREPLVHAPRLDTTNGG